MAGKGGARPGAGRPTVARELQTAELTRSVLIKKFGSLEASLEWLLESKDTALIRFAFEHAFGKSPEKIEHSGKIDHAITGMEIITK